MPQALADRNAERFKALLPQIEAEPDFFIRTSDPEHKRRVSEVLERVKAAGHVYKGLYEGWYCPRCADFKSETEIEDGNRCPIHHIELTWQREENWFFRLSAFQERLEALFAAQPEFVRPAFRANEAKAFIGSGLRDFSISRSSITWGIPIPWDPEQVVYVWFDALFNYYTALAFARPGEDLTERFWPASLHVMAKDILKFHTVFWPAMLMAAELPLPEQIYVHGYLLMDGEKMSKSLGNVLDPFAIIERFGADALRYYLFREVSFGQDGSVSTVGFETRYETELANEYGNLASRTLAMVARYRDGAPLAAEIDPALAGDLASLPGEVAALMDRVELTQALEVIWRRVRRLNRYVEEREPWKQAKDPDGAAALDVTLATLLAGLRAITRELAPYLPATADQLTAALDAPRLEPIAPLFPKIAA